MASNTLTANSIASTYAQLLHIGTGTAGASTVRTGDGTTTVLEFVSGGAKINGTFNATGNTTLGGTLAVTGAITALGVPVFRLLTSDVVASTNTNVDISDFDFVPVSGAVYMVEMCLIARSVATSTGVQIVNTGGAGTLILVDPVAQISLGSAGGTYAGTSAPAANTNYGIQLVGSFAPSSTGTLSFAVKSEVASSAVTIKAGSVLKITRIS